MTTVEGSKGNVKRSRGKTPTRQIKIEMVNLLDLTMILNVHVTKSYRMTYCIVD